jgi:hypothetical protein
VINRIHTEYLLPPGTELRAIPTLPRPVRIAEGRWRTRIRYRLHSAVTVPPVGLPPPLRRTGDRHLICTGMWLSPRELALEVLSDEEDLKPGVYPYVYTVGKWLQMLSADLDVTVDGVRDHPMLRQITFPDSYLEMLRTDGYLDAGGSTAAR